MGRLLLVLLVLLGLTRGEEPSYYNKGSYDFSWSVLDKSSGNQFGHSENRLGYDTSGEYHVLLPDGRTQTVTYTVDPYTGFQAKVDFAGEPTYGATSYGAYPKPVYSPYKPAYHHPPPKPVYAPYKPAYHRPPKPVYSPAKPVYHHPPPKPVYQTAAATYHQTFASPQDPIYNSIVYTPTSYVPAPIQNYAHEVHNLVKYKAAPTHAPAHAPEHVTPLSPPENHEHEEPEASPDPYLASPDELEKMDFTGSFFYPYETKILKKGRKLDPEKKDKNHNHV